MDNKLNFPSTKCLNYKKETILRQKPNLSIRKVEDDYFANQTKEIKFIKPNFLMNFKEGFEDNYYSSLLDWNDKSALLATNNGIAHFNPDFQNFLPNYIEKKDALATNTYSYISLKLK